MAISAEQQALILRYYHAEHWRIGTIATQLSLHRDTVSRVLAQAQSSRAVTQCRESMIDPYLAFILETLGAFPDLNASRLYAMVKARGYPGGADHFRHLIARYRPRKSAQAYLRLRTLPGEQMQCDWGHFGHLAIGRARRPLMAFVMVLSWSRQVFVRFYTDARMENFLRGHVAAFDAWGGLARVVLYDNLKSAVLERQGQAIRFNPTLLELSSHYRFEPRPVAPARGNEKGRVERAIRYIRGSFFAARRFDGLEDLNHQARAWCEEQASQRRCPEDNTLTVAQAFAHEREHLLALPGTAFPTDEIKAIAVGKTPYVRFDLNDYSIPHTHVQRTLTVRANLKQVRVLDGQTVLATHARSYDRGQQIECVEHIEALARHKRAARAHRGCDRLLRAAPGCAALLTQAAERGEPIARITRTLQDLLDRYGASQLQAAVEDALARGVPHPNAVSLALERSRQLRHGPPPLAVALPERLKHSDIAVQPHSLRDYDALWESDHE